METCKTCKYLMFSDCYGECSIAIKGIVSPTDSCKYWLPKTDNQPINWEREDIGKPILDYR